jgi:hypothetical protein
MRGWLRERVDPTQIRFDQGTAEWHEEWNRFVDYIPTDAEVWWFRSPDETWTSFPRRGWEGYAVVRAGEVIDFILTAVS